MSVFAPSQIAALRELRGLWKGVDFCLIGASAVRCHVELPRVTNDLDITLSVPLDSFPGGLESLPGWSRHPTKEHEWHGPGDVQVDVVPAGQELLAQGAVTWPRSGYRMSLVGMRLAFATASPFAVASDLSIPVPKLFALAVLKMVAYLDRPQERQRDLEDLSYIFDNYISTHDDRVFSEEVPREIELFRRPAFLLGADLRPVLNEAERQVVRRFVELARGASADTTRSRLIRLAPRRWREHDDPDAELDAILDSFELGLGERVPSVR